MQGKENKLFSAPFSFAMSTGSLHSWYCLRAKPRQESLAARQLRAFGVEVFAPRIRFRRARSTGVAWVNEALFPGYLFANFDYKTEHRHIASAQGVASIVKFGGDPSIVDEQLIHNLRQSLSEGEMIEVAADIAAGDEVSIVQGPFAGVKALVTRLLPSRERVAILFQLLGEEREVEVDLHSVLAKKQHPLNLN